MRQRVDNPRLKWWQGILLIVGIVALLTAFQFIAAVVSYMTGDPDSYSIASIAFWAFGGVIALYLMRAFIMGYEYSIEGLSFRICRVYGSGKPREALTIVTRSIEAIGTPEEIQGKYPSSHPSVFIRKKSGLEVVAVAYSVDGRLKVIHIQPDEAFRQRLADCIGK